ncbi:glycine N-acyltransferase-like protein 2 isoform X3 [Bufo bufo]|uniref:glycine N-acyltransferase-like protein 2 isoform X3 n=1 Tax=Bufo bufo TaxID=8384 RepID=UPI001ABE6A15|nr:glycine N-acyltransferase-like protein 2 isoform X3 [Bufo bufo]
MGNRMLVLTCSSKLASVRRLLTHSFPESLKVCGALHHVIEKNPFRLQVLVDQWPDFTSVICRPPLEEMTDPSDHYTNTYFLFSKDPQGLRQFLQDPQTVNWKQELQIQGCQPSLTGVLQEVSSKHGSQMHTTSNLLYMKDGMKSEDLEKISNISSDELQFAPLKTHEASYVNEQWIFGKNDHSLHFIERCIQTFPSIGVRKKGVDQPIAWGTSDHSMEIRMGYTLPAYRNLGLSSIIILKISAINHNRRFPMYAHTAPDNKTSQAVMHKTGFQQTGRWVQWNFQRKSLKGKY